MRLAAENFVRQKKETFEVKQKKNLKNEIDFLKGKIIAKPINGVIKAKNEKYIESIKYVL